jgi:hypothetical protein
LLQGQCNEEVVARQLLLKLAPLVGHSKAMQGDCEKCLEVGASDYITQPIDTKQLLLLLRVWLYR